jgi:hypothetical protein
MSLYIVTMLRERTKHEQNDRGYIKTTDTDASPVHNKQSVRSGMRRWTRSPPGLGTGDDEHVIFIPPILVPKAARSTASRRALACDDGRSVSTSIGIAVPVERVERLSSDEFGLVKQSQRHSISFRYILCTIGQVRDSQCLWARP